MLEFFNKLFSNTETKPFYTTSEFWVLVAGEITDLSGALPGTSGTLKSILAVVIAAAYAISRGLAKAGTKPTLTTPAPTPPQPPTA